MSTAGCSQSPEIPPTLPKDIYDWSEDNVAAFFMVNERVYRLKNDHIHTLKRNKIDGFILFDLKNEDLVNMGLEYGQAMKFLKLLMELKNLVEPGKQP